MSVSITNPSSGKLKANLAQIAQFAWIAIAFATAIYLQVPQLAAIKERGKTLSKEELQREEAKNTTRMEIAKNLPTFGYRNLVAGWYFIDFAQYFGDSEVRRKAGYGSAMNYFDAILDRDPRFLYAYFYLSTTGSIYVGNPARSVGIMNRGLKSLTPQVPDRGFYIWRLKATDELLFLGKVADARNSMLTAADWARQSTDPQGRNVAQLSQNTAAYLARNPNSKQARFDAWRMVLGSAADEVALKRAIAEIQSLGGKVTITPTGEIKVEAPRQD